MKIYFDARGTTSGLKKTVQKALKDRPGGLVILAAHGNGFTPESLNPLLREIKAPLVGGLFPTVIYSGKAYSKGSVVLGFSGRVTVATTQGLSVPDTDFEQPLQELQERSAGARTMLVFVDGFGRRITPFMNGLFDVFGLEINYIGGGAGSLEPECQPCLLSNAGMLGDSAVMALVESESGVGVAHGWQTMSEPMQATHTEGNLLKAIEFRTAFDVYSEEIARRTGVSFRQEDFFRFSRKFPFGIARMNREMIVRDPLKVTPEGAFVCAGEIPQDSYISIMNGNEPALLAAAEEAAAAALAALPNATPAAFLLMDCISREVFLEDKFEQELSRMAPAGSPSAGACTIGEIANCGAEFLEFYNKTAVVAALEAR